MASDPSPARSCAVCESHAETVFRIDGMDCANEVAILERRVKALRGVHEMRADVMGGRLHVAHDAATLEATDIAQAVAETGMRAFVEEGTRRIPATSDRRRTILLGASGLLALAATVMWWRGSPAPVIVPLAVGAITAGGPWTARRAWGSLRSRSLDINVLMVVAVIGAMLLGDWAEAASVTFLFALAQWLEVRSMERARHAVTALVDLAPSEATVRRDARESRVPVADVVRDDLVIVRPGEKIPVDGTIVAGQSDINQAPVTGESLPVARAPGEQVFAGTINGHGSLEVQVTRVGRDSTLARIIHLVEDAQSRRAPAQAFVDRFARIYTPSVLVMAVLVAIVPPLLFGAVATDWIYRALVLLVIACPCALVISTPVSIVSALAAAARNGVLIKGGVYLERAAYLGGIAFDKTGTLTEGRLAVERVTPVNGRRPEHVLANAAAIEQRSEHPIGRAIVSHARRHGIGFDDVEGFTALPGRGAQAVVGGRPVLLGNHRLFHERELCSPELHASLDDFEGRGHTAVFLAMEGEPLGAIAVADQPRLDGAEAIDALRAAGVSHVAMLTGDSRRTADAIAERLGVAEVYAELLPEDKVRVIENLRARWGSVAMVGDGVNDAPALARADLGIAMGAAGSDVALETADVALIGDDLTKVAWLVRLGRATLRNIKTNIAVAIGLKAVFLALAVAGQATLWMAVAADMGASLLVIGNGLRLLRAEDH